MTRLTAEVQPRLSPVVCGRLVATGVAFRLMRSGITVAVQAVAVAFLVYVFAGGMLDTAVRDAASQAVAPYRAADTLLTRLRQPDAASAVTDALATPGDPRVDEYTAWAGWADDQRGGFASAAQRWRRADAWVDGLRAEERVLLLGDAMLSEFAEQLLGADERRRVRKLLQQRQLTPPGGPEALLEKLTTDRQTLTAAIAEARAGHARAIRDVSLRGVDERLLSAPGADTAKVLAALQEAGYVVDESVLQDALPFLERRRLADALRSGLQEPTLRRAVARRAKVGLNEVRAELLPELIHDDHDAAWVIESLPDDEPRVGLTAKQLVDFAWHARREARLKAVAPPSAGPNETRSGWWGLPPRTVLLVALSCLVCVAGVTNAMMMSVTERFTEIATMKCLGARSGSVLTLFLLESGVLGVAGGLIGVVLGLGLTLAIGLVKFGALLTEADGVATDLAILGAGALAFGVLLSMLAALLPSMFAARLPPMAAMRVE